MICRSISDLEEIVREKVRLGCENRSVGRVQRRVVDLIGGRCVVHCLIHGLMCEATWDTGG